MSENSTRRNSPECWDRLEDLNELLDRKAGATISRKQVQTDVQAGKNWDGVGVEAEPAQITLLQVTSNIEPPQESTTRTTQDDFHGEKEEEQEFLPASTDLHKDQDFDKVQEQPLNIQDTFAALLPQLQEYSSFEHLKQKWNSLNHIHRFLVIFTFLMIFAVPLLGRRACQKGKERQDLAERLVLVEEELCVIRKENERLTREITLLRNQSRFSNEDKMKGSKMDMVISKLTDKMRWLKEESTKKAQETWKNWVHSTKTPDTFTKLLNRVQSKIKKTATKVADIVTQVLRD